MTEAAGTEFEYEALYDHDDNVWREHVTHLGKKVAAHLPNSHYEMDSVIWTLELHWQDGPAPRDVEKLLTELIGEKPGRYSDDDLDLRWERLNVELHRNHGSRARGYALLCAALSGSCRQCDGGPDTFTKVYNTTLRARHPEKLEQHRSLTGLEALGVDSEKLELLAELLGALHEDSRDAGVLHHQQGHLAGLTQLSEAVHT